MNYPQEFDPILRVEKSDDDESRLSFRISKAFLDVGIPFLTSFVDKKSEKNLEHNKMTESEFGEQTFQLYVRYRRLGLLQNSDSLFFKISEIFRSSLALWVRVAIEKAEQQTSVVVQQELQFMT